MLIFLPLGLALVFLGMWIHRRSHRLSRACRWREDRRAGPGRFRCAACGVECVLPPGRTPRDCLRPPPDQRVGTGTSPR
ncbi:hypothetical protein [Pseudogemmobacter sonorensis]|uniref:hypothetical protein n=1 Tax=Pseudogemmobacter sonorensis TaxID=2989681 RepID=UPI0036AA8EE6